MATPWNLEDSPKRKLFFFLLALVVDSAYATGDGDKKELLGKIGGNVSFHCPVKSKNVKMLYLQKGREFVNGFYVSRNVTDTWQNTQMDEKNMIINMHNLTVWDQGTYECIFEYENNPQTHTTCFDLRITGDFSEPEFTVLSSEKINWTVMCSSHGGYPSSKMTWNTNGSRMVEVLNNTETTDPVTLTTTSSSKAVFDCSKDEIQFISCSVGDVTSKQFTICTSKPPGPPDHTAVIGIVTIILSVVGMVTIAVFVKNRKKCRRRGGAEEAAPPAGKPEWVNGKEGPESPHTVEETALIGGPDAP